MSAWDSLWTNARIATMAPVDEGPYGAIADGAIAVSGGVIDWIGPTAELDRSRAQGVPVHDAGGSWITPGLIDCHTHIVYSACWCDLLDAAGLYGDTRNGSISGTRA